MDDHSSGTLVAKRFVQPTRVTSQKQPRCFVGIMPPLFGLAPGGVYLAKVCYQTRGALLPHLFTLTARKARRFVSVALSLGLPPPDVIRHRVLMEPGLSSPTRLSTLRGRGHPANWLVWR